MKENWKLKKVKPKYCKDCSRKLFLYYCFSCKKFHWPYKIWKETRMKQCKCGNNSYEWTVDELYRSWLKCADCGDNFFSDGVGVVLINWYNTDVNRINLDDVLKNNKQLSKVMESITE